MEKEEYDRLISENYVTQIAFEGDLHPHVAQFVYAFESHHLSVSVDAL